MSALETILALFQDPAFLHWPGEKRHQAAALTQALRTLTLAEAGALAEQLLGQREQEEEADHLLGQVNAAVPGALVPFHAELIERQVFWPGWLYLGATPATSERLLQLVHVPPEEVSRHDLLGCLAWIEHEQVTETFRTWQRTLPSWYVPGKTLPPEAYSLAAGWEVLPEGHRRLLYVPQAYELVRPSELSQGASPLAVVTAHEERCPWCQRPLLTLLDLDLGDPRWAELIAVGERLRIATCDWCSGYTDLFTEVDLTGASHWSDGNGDPPDVLRKVGYDNQDEDVPWPEEGLVGGALRRTPFETLDRYRLGENGISQVGGHPEWVQSPSYPRCPTCTRRMICFGQISWEDLDEHAEGITYVFLCLSCHKAATCYQQT